MNYAERERKVIPNFRVLYSMRKRVPVRTDVKVDVKIEFESTCEL